MTSFQRFLLIPILILSFFLNTIQLGNIPGGLHGDEAQHGLQAIDILQGKHHVFDFGWYGLPIPSFFAQAAGVWVFGNTIFALRIPSAIIGTLTIIPFYFLVLLAINRRTALFSSLFLATSHWWIAFSRLGENYIQVASAAVIGFLLILLSFRTKKLWIAVLAGIAIGSNFYLYFAARLTPILACILVAYVARTMRWGRKYFTILSFIVLGFLITVLPFFITSIHKGGFVFSRQNDVYIYSTGLGSQWRQNTYGKSDIRSVMLGQFQRSFQLRSTWHDTSGQYGYRGIMIDPASGILLMCGILGIFLVRFSKFSSFPLIWLVITLFAGWILTENPPFSPRVVGAIPALAMIIGIGVSTIRVTLQKAPLIIRILIICLLALYAVFYNINAYFIRGVQQEWGDANKYTATEIVRTIQTLPNYTLVFLTAPMIHADFGPIQYLLPDAEIVSIANPDGYQPKKTPHTVYIIHPSYDFLLQNIIALNPGGKTIRNSTHGGNVRFILYQVE